MPHGGGNRPGRIPRPDRARDLARHPAMPILGRIDGIRLRPQDIITTQRVLGYAALFGVLNVVIMTALATLFSFLYNLSATVLGGLEVTLAED